MGAGAAGVGISKQIAAGLRHFGLSAEEAKARIFVLDSKGLLLEGREGLEPYKQMVVQGSARVADWTFAGTLPNLLETIQNAKITTLIGVSGQPSAFNQQILQAVSAHTPCPTIFAPL